MPISIPFCCCAERTEPRILEIFEDLCEQVKNSHLGFKALDNGLSILHDLNKLEGDVELAKKASPVDRSLQKQVLRTCKSLLRRFEDELLLMFHKQRADFRDAACVTLSKGKVMVSLLLP